MSNDAKAVMTIDIQTYVRNAVAASRAKSLAESDQLTLGELILKIKPIVIKQAAIIEIYKHEAQVVYDFEHLFPTAIDSWRGSYSELALDFKAEGESMKITDFLAMLESTVGKEFTGYKGGEFIMSRQTPVWVANYGNSGNTAVIDVVDNEYEVILITGRREY